MLRLLFIFGLLSVLFSTQGQNYSTYTVTTGDTLWKIANNYSTTVSELQRLNNLSSSILRVGQLLYLPVATGGVVTAENSAILLGYPASFKLHVVNPNENLFSISKHYNLSEDTLKNVNPEVVGTPPAGTLLRIPPNSGSIITLQPRESLLNLALKYHLSPSELAKVNGVDRLSALAGQKVFIPIASTVTSQKINLMSMQQESSSAPSPTPQNTPQSTPQDTLLSRRELLRTQQLALLQRAPTILLSYNTNPSSKKVYQDYNWPLHINGRITSHFGRRNLVINGSNFHAGLDIAAPTGTPILAAKSGVVAKVGWLGGYGYAVYLNHNDGTQTRYAHMSAVSVYKDQHVTQGAQIGLIGSTGISTGPHLHFELRVNGYAVNPLDYLAK